MNNVTYIIEFLPAFILFVFHRADIVNRVDYAEESTIFYGMLLTGLNYYRSLFSYG